MGNAPPGRQGVPTSGSNQRSSPIQPAVFHAKISRIAITNSIALVDAVPAMMKFQFSSPLANAAIAVNAPKISAMPINSSPNVTSRANQGY